MTLRNNKKLLCKLYYGHTRVKTDINSEALINYYFNIKTNTETTKIHSIFTCVCHHLTFICQHILLLWPLALCFVNDWIFVNSPERKRNTYIYCYKCLSLQNRKEGHFITIAKLFTMFCKNWLRFLFHKWSRFLRSKTINTYWRVDQTTAL